MKGFIVSGICALGIVLLAANHGAAASSMNGHSIAIAEQSLLVLAGFGCNFVNGQLVCGKSGGKNSNDNDDEADDHDNSKKHKKHEDTDNERGPRAVYHPKA